MVRSWLGHASIETTHAYIEIDLEMKRAALDACAPPGLTSPAPTWTDPDLSRGWRGCSCRNYVEQTNGTGPRAATALALLHITRRYTEFKTTAIDHSAIPPRRKQA